MSDGDINLKHLRVLSLLLEVGSLTRAAEILGTSEPTISKTLARLRGYFSDPLFVRVGHAMHPTPKALELARPVAELLARSAAMRLKHATFDPMLARREFSLILTAVGMITLLPPILQHLETAGPGLKLKAVPLDQRQIERRLEGGEADIALGAFSGMTPSLRRQRLYTDTFVSVTRRDHPRRQRLAQPNSFLGERHVLVTASNTGHEAHRRLEQVLGRKLHPDRIHVQVPSFVAAATIAGRTEAIATLPARLAETLAEPLGLSLFPPPLTLPRIEICQFWHERLHHDPGHGWLRAVVRGLFSASRLKRPAAG